MSNPLLILVQARMNSSRFPGKIMKEVLGIPLLVHQLNRIARIKTVAKISLQEIAKTNSRENNKPNDQ